MGIGRSELDFKNRPNIRCRHLGFPSRTTYTGMLRVVKPPFMPGCLSSGLPRYTRQTPHDSRDTPGDNAMTGLRRPELKNNAIVMAYALNLARGQGKWIPRQIINSGRQVVRYRSRA